MSVEVLIDQLWAGLELAAAVRALRSEVHRLREVLWGCATVETRPAAYRLTIDPADLDLAQFERAATDLRGTLATDSAACRRHAESVLQLWRGRPFGDLVEVPELLAEQARLQDLRVEVIEVRAEAWLTTGLQGTELIGELVALTAALPLRERLWALLLKAYWRAGRQAEALGVYQQARAMLVEEFGLEPSPELRRLEAAVLAHDVDVLGAPSRPVAHDGTYRRAALSVASAGFVGRSIALDALGEALHEFRLITLVGPGGIGKTRLAKELLSRRGGGFRDGAYFVDLAAVTSSASVSAVVAATLGVHPSAGIPLADAIAEATADRLLLLVIDNCEHVIDAAAELVDRLVSGTTSLVVLATSRAPLGLDAEQVWPVEALDARSEGVELFCVRARSADINFRVSDAERDVIADLCVRLDGLPLAIELAASRARAFGAIAVASQLVGPGVLDVAWGRGRPERHQTLRLAIGWSYDLLSPAERELFCALSVFVGEFDLEAIRAVTGGAAVGPVVQLVAGLVDQAVLSRVDSVAGPRFTMLETLRQFGAEQLSLAGTTVRYRRAHAEQYAVVVEREHRRCWTSDEPDAWATLAQDWANIRLAFQTAIANADCGLIGRICRGLAFYSLFSGNSEVGVWARDAVMSGLLDGDPAELVARGVWGIHAYWIAGDLAETAQAVGSSPVLPNVTGSAPHRLVAFMVAQALADRERADEVSRAWSECPGDDADSVVLAAAVRAYYGLWLDDPCVDASAWCEMALEHATRLGAPTLLCYVLLCKAQIVGEADPETAIELTDRAISILEPLPVTGWIALAPLCYRMAAQVLAGHQDQAIATTVEVLERSHAQRFRQGARFGLWSAAVCLARAGRVDEALTFARRSGAHVGRSSLGVTAELTRLFGDSWRQPLRGQSTEHRADLLDAIDAALNALRKL